jgi:signal transduction histidine kinase
MNATPLTNRYERLSQHVGWEDRDAELLRRTLPAITEVIPEIIDDFYVAIRRNPETAKIITGGAAQIERLKSSLTVWLHELFSGATDSAYLDARRQVGKRHVDIGLPPSYTNVAMGLLRTRLCRHLRATCPLGQATEEAIDALCKRMDLDLALITDAYHREFLSRQQPVNQSRIRQQRALVKLSHRALSSSELSSLFEYAVLLVADSLAADQCAILEWQEHENTLALRASFGLQLPDLAETTIAMTAPHQAARILRERQILTVDDCRAHAEMPVTPLPGHEKVVSMAGAPLWSEQRPWGVLLVHTLQQRNFLPGDQDCLQAMANVLSASLGRRDTEAKMLQAERLAAIGQMITGIAHEARNSLQRIQACTEMLQLEFPAENHVSHLIQRIERAQFDLTRLFDEVRGYAAPLSLMREHVDLRQLWRNAWSELQPLSRQHSAALQDDQLNDVDLMVHADSFRLTQVFRNLFENAIASGSDQTVVAIRVEDHSERSPRTVRIQISDNGPGFTEAAQSRAFDPFFTTRTKGTGLGLPISRRIVEAHGGSIEIDTRHGPGACIVINLPK